MVDSLPGDAGSPLSAPALRAKFVRYTTPVIGAAAAERIASALLEGSLGQAVGEALAPADAG